MGKEGGIDIWSQDFSEICAGKMSRRYVEYSFINVAEEVVGGKEDA
jgi:hypothetical protein